MSLPIIDIGPYVNGTASEEEKNRIAFDLDKACQEWGFFYVKGHGISETIIKEVREVAKKFFSLPFSEKKKISLYNSDKARGYQKLGENVTQKKADWHEGIDFVREPLELKSLLLEKGALYGNNQWPEEPSEFKPLFEDYIEKMKQLGTQIMSLMAIGLGFKEDFFNQFISDPFWVMRVIGYPNLNTNPGSIGVEDKAFASEVGISCGEHTDYGCLTMVNQDDTKGALQVKTASGEWINADPIEGAFVMNLGDVLKVWTRNKYQSTPHRVINTNSDYRISIPFFFEPNFTAYIKPLDIPGHKGDGVVKEFLYGDHLISKVNYNFQPSQLPDLDK